MKRILEPPLVNEDDTSNDSLTNIKASHMNLLYIIYILYIILYYFYRYLFKLSTINKLNRFILDSSVSFKLFFLEVR